MSDYTQTTSFGPKDSLEAGNPGKIIKGTEFDTEFAALSTAIASKIDDINTLTSGTVVANDDLVAVYDTSAGSQKKMAISTVTSLAVPSGSIVAYGVATAPSGWLICDGAAVNRTTYAALFAVIGETYGAGNGSTTFNVPDLRGRAPFGKDDMGSGAASRITTGGAQAVNGAALGTGGGAQDITLTTAQMPAHTHTITLSMYQACAASSGCYAGPLTSCNPFCSNTSAYSSASTTGSSAAHGNLPPLQITAYIIKT